MRGRVSEQHAMWIFYDPERLLPPTHPLREVKTRADAVLRGMSADFDRAYAVLGRPSIPPEMLLKALLLQALHTIRSEALLVEHIAVNLAYRWFLDLEPHAEAWNATTFTHNRERFEKHGLLRIFFDRVVDEAYLEKLASKEHFSVDGSLIESYASMKSLRRIDSPDQKVSDGSVDGDPGNPSVDFRNEKRTNATHRSITDPEARLATRSKGQPVRLCHQLNALMENRHGLLVDVSVVEANGTAEREQALLLLEQSRTRHDLPKARTVGMDGGYPAGAFLQSVEEAGMTAHVPIPAGTISDDAEGAEARRRARERMETVEYSVSQRCRKRIEEIFGWEKEIGGMRRSRHVGRWKLTQKALIVAAAYNLLRLARLAPCPQPAA
jgi:transposase